VSALWARYRKVRRERGKRLTAGPFCQGGARMVEQSGPRGVISLVGRIRGASPNRVSSSFSFILFSFLSLFKFKLYSNLIQTILTNFSQMMLRHKQYYFEDILLYILFLYLFSFWFQF
jgi:hypothetical protein